METQKSQTIRLIDVFALGPFMIYSGAKIPPTNPNIRTLLILAGALTIAYNGGNYLENI